MGCCRSSLVALLLGGLGLGTALAALGAGRFEVFARTILIPERGEVAGCVLRMETNQFVFIPPPDWIWRTAPKEQKLVLSSQDGTRMITLQFTQAAAGETEPVKADRAKEQILEKYPGARILEEYTCYTGLGDGPAFELERAAATAIKPHSRIAFIALPGYVLVINATASNGELKPWQFPFANLCASLRNEPLTPAKGPPK